MYTHNRRFSPPQFIAAIWLVFISLFAGSGLLNALIDRISARLATVLFVLLASPTIWAVLVTDETLSRLHNQAEDEDGSARFDSIDWVIPAPLEPEAVEELVPELVEK